MSQTGQQSNSIVRTVLQMVAQKLKPGIVASYDIGPGNGEGLFLFWRFTNLSLTYLLKHLPNYSPGPTWGDAIVDIMTSPLMLPTGESLLTTCPLSHVPCSPL